MPSPMRRSARGAPTSHSKPAHASKSATPRSNSSEDPSEPPRRSQRSHPSKDDAQDDMDGDDAIAEEEEVTRCICEQQDYPGPPQSEAFDGVDSLSEDTGGLFIQCDGCSVWQHGGCVGIIEESQSPDKYYCEDCRPKQHELHVDSRGQKYSLYLPLHPKTARKGSVGRSDDRKRERETTASRASADPVTGRRRATMRSKEHDAEEEAFQRALEESKREVGDSGGSRRTTKRTREDNDEVKQEFKRQRTLSDPRNAALTVEGDDSDEDTNGEAGTSKKARADAVQSARQTEIREKEGEKEKARQEAAGRRQERAGRRRADEPDISDETPNPSKQSPPPSSQPGSPQPTSGPRRKGGKKAKKLGNNQYTMNRGDTASSPHGRRRHLLNNQGVSSGDEQPLPNGDSIANTSNGRNSPGGQENGTTNGKAPGGRFGKGRGKANGAAKQPEEPVERTYVNMRHSLTAMVAFVQKQQPDMSSGDRTPPDGDALPNGGAVQSLTNGDKEGRPFAELNSLEMAEVFARNVDTWNQRYAHLA